MGKIVWTIKKIPRKIWIYFKLRIQHVYIKFMKYFCGNEWSWNSTCDVLMEPLFWFIENFTGCLGPMFVVMVTILTAFIVYIAYYVGLHYWWQKSPTIAVILIIVGHWLLVNVCFHYYMGVKLGGGYPPDFISQPVKICKKCHKPKPPRTHHCSICNKCILKMDHHCPWLNSCVGHHNHRHFFQYMCFTIMGMAFIMIFGAEIAYEELWLDHDQDLDGHPVRFNDTQLIPVTESLDHLTEEELKHVTQQAAERSLREYRRKLIIFAGLICVATFLALGALAWWHAGLISRGETSIEAHINSTQTEEYKAQGKVYKNPYDFGRKENWKIFFGLNRERSWWRIVLPSTHKPLGDGLTWRTATNIKIS